MSMSDVVDGNIARLVQQLQVGGFPRARRGSGRRQCALRALLLRSFASPAHAGAALPSAAGGASPGFQLAFGNQLDRAAHLLAAVDEEGAVSIIDTAARLESEPGASILRT